MRKFVMNGIKGSSGCHWRSSGTGNCDGDMVVLNDKVCVLCATSHFVLQ